MSIEAARGPLAEYARLTANTLADWRDHPGVGDPVRRPAWRGALGITVGCWLPRSDAVLAIHDQLAALAAADAQLELVPRTCLHFTFMALHWDLYEGWPATPKELRQILPILDTHVGGLDFAVHDLRLVPLKSALLLAGIPDAASAAARQALVSDLLASPWRRFLLDRYAGYPLPPQVWHTTLARYSAQFASQSLREVYLQNAALRLPQLSMGQPRLVLASETWSRCLEREA